jgi:RNA polymerase sigma factor (sigma-70 family)
LDEEEIAQFLRTSYPGTVRRVARRLEGDGCAEDLVQEALIRGWQCAASGEALTSLAAWVSAVAANLVRDHWRRRTAEQRALARLALEQPGLLAGLVPAPGEALLSEVAERVLGLPRRQRDVVFLRYYADRSVAETAALLGVSEGAVKRSLFQARQALHRALGPAFREVEESGAVRTTLHDTARWRRSMKGWFLAGSHPHQYDPGIAAGERLDGKRVGYLRARAKEPAGFGTLMQMIAPDAYRGKRVRFSGAARAIGVDGWAGLWMRVDGPEQGKALAFDNMQRRPIKGTTDWERYEVVLDVAEEARAVAFGVLIAGRGEMRFADFRFEVVPNEVPTTQPTYPEHPQNLDFADD